MSPSKRYCKTASVFVSKDYFHGTQSLSAIERNSGSTLVLQYSQQGFETIAAKLQPSSKLCYNCTPKFECGRSFEHSKLRLYLSLPETILDASLQLYLLLCCGYISCFVAAILAASLRLYLKLQRSFDRP